MKKESVTYKNVEKSSEGDIYFNGYLNNLIDLKIRNSLLVYTFINGAVKFFNLSSVKELLDGIEKHGGYGLTQATENSHKARRLAYRSAYYDRGGTEVLVSTRHGFNQNTHSQYINQRFYTGPTLNYVDMFPWEDGTEFASDFDWSRPSKQPFFVYDSNTKVMVPTPN